jgi:anti-sigma regulatory factor (Ser/Thr protein kinase)
MADNRKQRSLKIRNYILDHIDNNPQHISAQTAKHFGISRQAANKHINFLVKNGLVEFEGKTRSRSYSLKVIFKHTRTLSVNGLEEDKVWREHIRPHMKDVPDNVIALCQYGFTEMVNNVIDHSGSENVQIVVERTARDIEMWVNDNGVGIFNKIYTELNLDDPLHAILELSKGKLTTDPEHHTGEGVFFASRMFDKFSILSGNYYFSYRGRKDDVGGKDWFLEDKEENVKGTAIVMKINQNSSRTTREVFDYYTSKGDEIGFSKTHVPVFLAQYGDENLVSRSQAKRLIARFDRFEEIVLDFEKVETVGQAFADEIFRVFQFKHPTVELIPININEQVSKMINKAKQDLRNQLLDLKKTSN